MIGEREGTAVLHEIPAASGLSTLDDELHRHYRDATDFEVVDRTVPMMTLQAVIDRYVAEPVQFLKIDVEGHEASVLGGVDWERFRPPVVVVEATRPEQWEHLLLAAGYVRTLHDGLNMFFVREDELATLGPALSLPANVHDGYEVWRYVHPLEQLGRRVEVLQARVDELEAGAATPFGVPVGPCGTQALDTALGRSAPAASRRRRTEHRSQAGRAPPTGSW